MLGAIPKGIFELVKDAQGFSLWGRWHWGVRKENWVGVWCRFCKKMIDGIQGRSSIRAGVGQSLEGSKALGVRLVLDILFPLFFSPTKSPTVWRMTENIRVEIPPRIMRSLSNSFSCVHVLADLWRPFMPSHSATFRRIVEISGRLVLAQTLYLYHLFWLAFYWPISMMPSVTGAGSSERIFGTSFHAIWTQSVSVHHPIATALLHHRFGDRFLSFFVYITYIPPAQTAHVPFAPFLPKTGGFFHLILFSFLLFYSCFSMDEMSLSLGKLLMAVAFLMDALWYTWSKLTHGRQVCQRDGVFSRK